MSGEYPVVLRRITLVSYKMPGETYPQQVVVSTRDVQEVLQVLPPNAVSFSMRDELQGEIVVDGEKLGIRSVPYFNWSPTYYVDAEYVPKHETTECDPILQKGEVRLRLSDGSVEFVLANHFELVSFTG